MYWTGDSILELIDLTFEDNIAGSDDDDFGDLYDGGGDITCVNRCSAGQAANCEAATGLSESDAPCYVNCGACTECPAGTSNSATGSTTSDACVDCATGYASEANAASCTACQVPMYTNLSKPRFSSRLSYDEPLPFTIRLPRRGDSLQTTQTITRS